MAPVTLGLCNQPDGWTARLAVSRARVPRTLVKLETRNSAPPRGGQGAVLKREGVVWGGAIYRPEPTVLRARA